MPIDVIKTQAALVSSGYNPGPVDGVLGPSTCIALLAHQAKRQADFVIREIGKSLFVVGSDYGLFYNRYRLAEFIAETAHESGGYSKFEENMHYSAKRLMQVWPSRFKTLAAALPYAWDPSDPDREDEALANLVYGSRMGNQNDGTDDNDGWDHRGGGMLMHTGKEEYRLLKENVGVTPEQVHGDPRSMVLAACDFWKRKGANAYCDVQSFTSLRKVINGGSIGIDDVTTRRNRSLSVIF